MTGAKVLIVGVGSIGREIARLLSGAGLQVEGVGRRARVADADFGAIHGQEDLNCPATRSGLCRHRRTADGRKPRHVWRRAVRGDESDGAHHQCRTGRRGGRRGVGPMRCTLTDCRRGLDVTAVEPLPGNSPLWAMPQVILSPHMSGDYVGYHEAVVSAFIDNFRRFKWKSHCSTWWTRPRVSFRATTIRRSAAPSFSTNLLPRWRVYPASGFASNAISLLTLTSSISRSRRPLIDMTTKGKMIHRTVKISPSTPATMVTMLSNCSPPMAPLLGLFDERA